MGSGTRGGSSLGSWDMSPEPFLDYGWAYRVTCTSHPDFPSLSSAVGKEFVEDVRAARAAPRLTRTCSARPQPWHQVDRSVRCRAGGLQSSSKGIPRAIPSSVDACEGGDQVTAGEAPGSVPSCRVTQGPSAPANGSSPQITSLWVSQGPALCLHMARVPMWEASGVGRKESIWLCPSCIRTAATDAPLQAGRAGVTQYSQLGTLTVSSWQYWITAGVGSPSSGYAVGLGLIIAGSHHS